MNASGVPRDWAPAARYSIAMAAGVTWGFLWYGLDRLGLNVAWFWLVSVLLFAPVLATMARGFADLGGLAYVAYVASLLAALVPHQILLDDLPRTASAWADLTSRAAAGWAPTWLAAGFLMMYLTRRRTEVAS